MRRHLQHTDPWWTGTWTCSSAVARCPTVYAELPASLPQHCCCPPPGELPHCTSSRSRVAACTVETKGSSFARCGLSFQLPWPFLKQNALNLNLNVCHVLLVCWAAVPKPWWPPTCAGCLRSTPVTPALGGACTLGSSSLPPPTQAQQRQEPWLFSSLRTSRVTHEPTWDCSCSLPASGSSYIFRPQKSLCPCWVLQGRQESPGWGGKGPEQLAQCPPALPCGAHGRGLSQVQCLS